MSGPERLDSGPTRSRGRGTVLVAVVVVALLLAWLALDRRSRSSSPPPAPAPVPRTTPPARTTPPPTSGSSAPSSAPVTVRLGANQPWGDDLPAGRLYARSADSLYALDPRTGSLTVTGGLGFSTDAVSMVPTPSGVMLRPWDDSPGRFVRDGRPPAHLPGRLRQAAEALPGPAGRVWALTINGQQPLSATAVLVDERGRTVGPRLTTTGSFGPDGNAGLLLSDVGGVWQAFPGPLRRITSGTVTAVGARSYRVLECDSQHHCAESLRGRTGHDRVALPPTERFVVGECVISPAGDLLAGQRWDDGRPRTDIVGLPDGTVRRSLPGSAHPASSPAGTVTWLSPRWLALLADDRLVLYDAAGDAVVEPALPTGALVQLAWRPA